ncbi:PREDICTED: protein MIS12 homolog [Ceratosolen solmsi marchali]|uniref:Protein MIS12 homolog n=1 Tax=Ceratosolen solmsi marchali TaxID=326594 RepID=A0AAJ6YBA1_9HYME|nr:PREDICTED: protein MIS12 homolog [Ceratosolen solmsi marchali]
MANDSDRSAELSRRCDEEYQMQLFGMHSRTVSVAINQKIKENVDTRCEKIHASIEKKYNPDVKGKEILNNNIKQLRKTYLQNMQPHLITIQNIVDKFICVPNNVLLEEDKCQAVQYNDEEFHNLERKLEDLQNEAKRVTIFNAALKEELEVIEQIKDSEDLAKELCCIVDKSLSTKKLSNKTLRAIEKYKGLKESIDSLKQQIDKDNFNPRLNDNELEDIIIRDD